jgi:putative ABC transport system substrate-binding protein
VEDASDFADAFAKIKEAGADAMFVTDRPENVANAERIVEFANRYRLPTLTTSDIILRAGALLYYWPNPRARWRRSAFFVDKILKGAKPADLPVERPSAIDFIINLKTAKTLGITIPPEVLFQATEVIR